MAAVLYEQNRGEPLPTSRAALYDRFVEILLHDAEGKRQTAESFRKEWKRKLGTKGKESADTLFYGRWPLLKNLSLRWQEGDSEPLVNQAISYADKQGWLPQPRNESWLQEQMKILLSRTGLLAQRGDEYAFIHDTFREYLAASALASTYEPSDEEAWSYVSRWAERSWREVVLFLLIIWSDQQKNISKLILRIRESSNGKGVLFVGTALAEGARVGNAVEEGIVQTLLAYVKNDPFVYSMESLSVKSEALEVLSRLHGREAVAMGLLNLARDPEVLERYRVQAAEALGRLGRAEEAASVLMDLGRDPKAYAWERARAAEALERLDRTEEAASVLMDLGRDQKVWPEYRAQAAMALGRLGRAEEAVSILRDLTRFQMGVVMLRRLARDPTLGENEIKLIAEVLKGFDLTS